MGKHPAAIGPLHDLKGIVGIAAFVATGAVADLKVYDVFAGSVDQLMSGSLGRGNPRTCLDKAWFHPRR
jgi:hypothetical protein